MSGSSSRKPVLTTSLRAEIRWPSARAAHVPATAVGDEVGDGAVDDDAAVADDLATAGGEQLARGMPSRDKKPCRWPAGRVARPAGLNYQNLPPGRESTKAADSPRRLSR